MNQIQTCTLDQHNRATHLAHENQRLREAMHVIAVIAAGAMPDGLPHVARLARNALLGAAPPANFAVSNMATRALIHRCRWPGCTQIVGNDLWGCRAHWYALPNTLRAWIGRAYRQGMDLDAHPTNSYLRAHRAAIRFARDATRNLPVPEMLRYANQ